MRHSPHHTNHSTERRDYFRIEDDVQLRYLPVDQSSALSGCIPPQFSEDQRFSLMRELQEIDQENSHLLRLIADHHRDLENYLKSMNRKIDLIATTVANSLGPIPDQQHRHITLSEGGLSFDSDTELANDDYIALQLTLLPSYVTLVLFAKIINCSKQEKGFKIALSFVHLKDSDRQVLAKHIIQRQLVAKRQQQRNTTGETKREKD